MSAYGNKKKIRKNNGLLSENSVKVDGLVQGFVFGAGMKPQMPSSHNKPSGRTVAELQGSLPTFPLEIPRPKKKKAKPTSVPKKKDTPTVQRINSHVGTAHYEVKNVKIGTQEFSTLIIKGNKFNGSSVLLRKNPDGKRKEK